MPSYRLTKRPGELFKPPHPYGYGTEEALEGYGEVLDDPYFGNMKDAVVDGDVERLKQLVSQGASLTSTPSGGSTLMHLAAVEGTLPVLKYLVEAIGSPLGLLRPDSEGAAPLHWLCTLGGSMKHLSTSTLATQDDRPTSYSHGAPVVRALIGDRTTSMVVGAGGGGKPKYSVSVQKKLDALKWALHHPGLLDLVIDTGELQEGGFRCPQHLAAQFEELLAADPSPSAAQHGEDDEKSDEEDEDDDEHKGGDDDEEEEDDDESDEDDDEGEGEAKEQKLSLEEEAEARVTKRLRREARKRIANIRDAKQETPLIWACSFEVDGGASQDGARALERLPIAKLLVKLGADVNAQTQAGQTALHMAARAGALSLVEYLVYEAQASPAIRDIHGQPALTYAKLYGKDKNTIDLLKRTTPNESDFLST